MAAKAKSGERVLIAGAAVGVAMFVPCYQLFQSVIDKTQVVIGISCILCSLIGLGTAGLVHRSSKN